MTSNVQATPERTATGSEDAVEGGESPLLRVKNLEKHFERSGGWINSLFGESERVRAVDDVSFDIQRGEILSVVGESGCGKTTLGKTLLRLLEPTSGAIEFEGEDITGYSGEKLRDLRQEMQIIYQDPHQSLNPKKTVRQLIRQPLAIHEIGTRDEQHAKIRETLEDVGLAPVDDFIDRYPEELSGGQLQRVAFARALVLDPSFIVADEPTSMLDASIRARVLDLMDRLRHEQNLSFFVITHDISSARYLSDRIGVMYLGRIVELGSAGGIVSDGKHPYTKALVQSIPRPDPQIPFESADIEGDIPDPVDIPSGCRFHPRCPIAKDHCAEVVPEWRSVSSADGTEREVACHEVEPKQRPTD